MLQSPRSAVLVTADRSFAAFGVILGREVRVLPSLVALKRKLEEDRSGESEQGSQTP
jgi:hypothetical protein